MNTNNHKRRRLLGLRVAFALGSLLPLLMGGCPEFRNGVVDAVDALTRGLIFNQSSPDQLLQTAGASIINSALDLLFGQFRSKNTSTSQ